ncbi:MAG: hypothetical protein KAS32_04975 [Candidatus Peribacteraceae bacterium]|nr:hypothetical protein [Candidatus Peribacteraceae bacterium]
MKPAERDDLLIRLDERSRNIYKLVEAQEQHLKDLNDSTAENTTGVAVNKSGIRRIYWLIGMVIIAVCGIAGGIIPNL